MLYAFESRVDEKHVLVSVSQELQVEVPISTLKTRCINLVSRQ